MDYTEALRLLLSSEEISVLVREAARQNRAPVNLAIMILQREIWAICAREAIERGDEPDGRRP
jgi:hypothetical protein